MTLREKLIERSRAFLEPGEAPRHVFLGQTGMHLVWLMIPGFLIASFLNVVVLSLLFPLAMLGVLLFVIKNRVVVVTNHAVVLLSTSRFLPTFPKVVVARLPRSTTLGPLPGLPALFFRVQLGQERLWVHPRFKKDVRAADAEIGAGQPPALPN